MVVNSVARLSEPVAFRLTGFCAGAIGSENRATLEQAAFGLSGSCAGGIGSENRATLEQAAFEVPAILTGRPGAR